VTPDIPADVDTRIDALFSLDPSEFIAARDRETKELQAAGRSDDAKRVKALRRPTVAAWALNQVVRARPDALAELLAVSADLRTEQEAALSGNAAKFRTLLDRRRELERLLVNAAVDLLAESSSNAEQSRAELTGTLDAAAVDPDIAETLRRGRLERVAAAPSGFDLLSGMDLPAKAAGTGPAPKSKPAEKRSTPRPTSRPQQPVDELAAKRVAAEAAREKARASAQRAERIEVAATRRQRAKSAADSARNEVRRLETELARARRAADRADAELDQAKAAEQQARADRA
jgi:hypothetical protein